MIPINKRKISISVLFSVLTFGIYAIHWVCLLVENNRSINKNESSTIREVLCLLFVPFYNYYWWYTRGYNVKEQFLAHGYTAKSNGLLFLILCIFGLNIVSMAIMQSDFNSLPSEHLETEI